LYANAAGLLLVQTVQGMRAPVVQHAAAGEVCMQLVRILAVSGFLVWLAGSPPAMAEPVQITSGYLDMDGSFGTLVLEGERGFTFTTLVHAGVGTFDPELQCLASCAEGSTMSLGAAWSGIHLPGTATLDGETFQVGQAGGPNFMAIAFDGSVTLPLALGDAATVAAPFTFSGLFTHAPSILEPETIEQLSGRGTATVTLRAPLVNDPGWAYSSVRYEFAPTAPVPEPATVVLCGSALAAAALRRHRARSRRSAAAG
jgi:hypothetical protein